MVLQRQTAKSNTHPNLLPKPRLVGASSAPHAKGVVGILGSANRPFLSLSLLLSLNHRTVRVIGHCTSVTRTVGGTPASRANHEGAQSVPHTSLAFLFENSFSIHHWHDDQKAKPLFEP